MSLFRSTPKSSRAKPPARSAPAGFEQRRVKFDIRLSTEIGRGPAVSTGPAASATEEGAAALLLQRAMAVIDDLRSRCTSAEAERDAADLARCRAKADTAHELARRADALQEAERNAANLQEALRVLSVRTVDLARELAAAQLAVDEWASRVTASDVEVSTLRQRLAATEASRQPATPVATRLSLDLLRAEVARKDAEIERLAQARDAAAANARGLEARLSCLQQRFDDTAAIKRLGTSSPELWARPAVGFEAADAAAPVETTAEPVAERRRKRRVKAA